MVVNHDESSGYFLRAVCQEYFVDFQWGFAINKATVAQLSTVNLFLHGFLILYVNPGLVIDYMFCGVPKST